MEKEFANTVQVQLTQDEVEYIASAIEDSLLLQDMWRNYSPLSDDGVNGIKKLYVKLLTAK